MTSSLPQLPCLHVFTQAMRKQFPIGHRTRDVNLPRPRDQLPRPPSRTTPNVTMISVASKCPLLALVSSGWEISARSISSLMPSIASFWHICYFEALDVSLVRTFTKRVIWSPLTSWSISASFGRVNPATTLVETSMTRVLRQKDQSLNDTSWSTSWAVSSMSRALWCWLWYAFVFDSWINIELLKFLWDASLWPFTGSDRWRRESTTGEWPGSLSPSLCHGAVCWKDC